MKKIALITGISGQDGAFLAQLLLEKDYVVFGTHRENKTIDLWRFEKLGIAKHQKLHFKAHGLINLDSTKYLIEDIQPNEVYNFAAQSSVGHSFIDPSTTVHINAMSAFCLLEAIRVVNPKIRFFQASSAEMFGQTETFLQNENTPFHPVSPYGTSKLFAHWMTVNYRNAYQIFACSGILFNHESQLRGMEFVTRKIIHNLIKIKHGELNVLELGNLDAKRDWGYAKEYVDAIYLMMQANIPDTYVLATGRAHSVREFVSIAATQLDMNIVWEHQGEGCKEVGREQKTGKIIVRVNPIFYRPTDAHVLIGDSTKAKNILGWIPVVDLKELCKIMINLELSFQNEK